MSPENADGSRGSALPEVQAMPGRILTARLNHKPITRLSAHFSGHWEATAQNQVDPWIPAISQVRGYPRRRSQAEGRLRTYGRNPKCNQRTIGESLMESCMSSLVKAARQIVPAQVNEARSS